MTPWWLATWNSASKRPISVENAPAEAMTVLEVLTAATGYLEKHGVESPRLNAEHLLAHVLGKKKRLDLYMEFDRPLSDAERAPLRDLIRERGTGKPLQHLLGTAEFFGRTYLCDERALIPRPETEQLLELILTRKPFQKILDCGTGSGVIAITLALEVPEAKVTAVDISPVALDLARANAEKLEAMRIHFEEVDLLPSGTEKFHLIAANLPYIASGEMAGLQREVQFDPKSALDGGIGGLDFVEKLIAQAPARLESGALVALEIGHDQAERVRDLFQAHNYRDITIHADYQGIQRFVLAIYG